jgi:hypothetical protein
MAHFIEELQSEAEQAITLMRETAVAARRAHARAELMRHMQTTARKFMHRPRAEAVECVVAEWMEAWHLQRSAWPALEHEIHRFTAAFHDYVHEPSDLFDATVRDSCAALEAEFAKLGTSIADQMAFRSMCAHAWWGSVVPTPADLPGRKERPTIPTLRLDRPFWETGCAEQCR